ncbi:hypothetical protein ROHU_028501 [Labeo rohita]|uniref:Uncharacterized protein n=1 Tax=Labeo rohita TaxID=84645 RepID=A0A498M5W4_LABRO|nr:hypothetical protein ROHU_028501 [Labeo rohita]
MSDAPETVGQIFSAPSEETHETTAPVTTFCTNERRRSAGNGAIIALTCPTSRRRRYIFHEDKFAKQNLQPTSEYFMPSRCAPVFMDSIRRLLEQK